MKIMREKKDEKNNLPESIIVIQAHFKSFNVRISVHPNFYLLILYKYT